MKILFTKKKILFNCKSLSGGNACLPAACLPACCLPVCLLPVYLLPPVYLLSPVYLLPACQSGGRCCLCHSLPPSATRLTIYWLATAGLTGPRRLPTLPRSTLHSTHTSAILLVRFVPIKTLVTASVALSGGIAFFIWSGF